MASDLTWTKHVEETVHKANKVYLAYLNPQQALNLEYASPVWSPHLAKDIHEIEKVQTSFANRPRPKTTGNGV